MGDGFIGQQAGKSAELLFVVKSQQVMAIVMNRQQLRQRIPLLGGKGTDIELAQSGHIRKSSGDFFCEQHGFPLIICLDEDILRQECRFVKPAKNLLLGEGGAAKPRRMRGGTDLVLCAAPLPSRAAPGPPSPGRGYWGRLFFLDVLHDAAADQSVQGFSQQEIIDNNGSSCDAEHKEECPEKGCIEV